MKRGSFLTKTKGRDTRKGHKFSFGKPCVVVYPSKILFEGRFSNLVSLPALPFFFFKKKRWEGIPDKSFPLFYTFSSLKKKKGAENEGFLLFEKKGFTAFVLLRKTTKQQPKYYFLRDTSEKGQFSCVPSWQPFPVL